MQGVRQRNESYSENRGIRNNVDYREESPKNDGVQEGQQKRRPCQRQRNGDPKIRNQIISERKESAQDCSLNAGSSFIRTRAASLIHTSPYSYDDHSDYLKGKYHTGKPPR